MSCFLPDLRLHSHTEIGPQETSRGKEERTMIEEEATRTLDFETLRGAIERRDPDSLLYFYADDARLRIENAALPDSLAFELRGRSQIERFLRAVCDQEMTRVVQGGVVLGEGSVEFVEACQYPDGARISVKTTLELHEGRISRQLDVVERVRPDDGSER
jgi:hypothetical protein